MTKEWLVFAAMLMGICAMAALMNVLLHTPLFGKLVQPLPVKEGILPRKKWWKKHIRHC